VGGTTSLGDFSGRGKGKKGVFSLPGREKEKDFVHTRGGSFEGERGFLNDEVFLSARKVPPRKEKDLLSQKRGFQLIKEEKIAPEGVPREKGRDRQLFGGPKKERADSHIDASEKKGGCSSYGRKGSTWQTMTEEKEGEKSSLSCLRRKKSLTLPRGKERRASRV